jgi:hypothetical protein
MIIIAKNGIKTTKENKEALKQGLNEAKKGKKSYINRFYYSDDNGTWWAQGDESLAQFALNLGLSIEKWTDFKNKGGQLIEEIKQGKEKPISGPSGYYRPDCDSDSDCGGYQSYRV